METKQAQSQTGLGATETQKSKLADIINLIGAETYKRIFAPVSFGGSSFVPVTEKPFISLKPTSIQELASAIQVSPTQHESVLRQIFELTQKYPVSAEQARSLYDILTSQYVETIKIKKGWGPFKKTKKKTIIIRPHPEVLERELPRVVIPESLIAETQRALSGEVEALLPKLSERIRKVDIEKLRLPEMPWLTEYKGVTLAEKARESAQKFNEQMQVLIDWTKEVLNQLKSPDTAKSVALALTSSFISDVMGMIHAYSGGTLDIRSFMNQLYDVTAKSKEYLNNLSQMFSNLLSIKVDLLSDLQKALASL